MDAPFKTVAIDRNVEELELDTNGLRVLLVCEPAIPVVSTCVVYHVGSRNEAVGHTGATHLLEHLMFRGSRKFNGDKGTGIARSLERVGAGFNATTWFDRTTYYETLPPEQLELALELEADRMRHALLRDEDLAAEMTVVRNEFERGENDPFDALLKESFAIAFREHPYHHPTIGWRADIENVSLARLRDFYDTFYYPDNASLVVVGSFDRAVALTLVARHFRGLPRSPKSIPRVHTSEPPQEGERRFIVRRAGEIGWVAVTWRTPEAAHADTHPLAVLADALSGGVTARLYQQLVEPGKCLDVQAVAWQLHDPGLFQVFATLNPPTGHAEVEQTVRGALARIAQEGLSAEELERAKVQVEAQTAYHRDSPSMVAAALAEAVSAADWRFYLDYLDRIRAVTLDDIARVAARYFHDDAISVGYFVPRDGAGGPGAVPTPGPQPRTLVPRPPHWRSELGPLTREARLGGGGRALLLPMHHNPTVHLYGSLLAGHGILASGRWSAASLLCDMLERGTARFGRLELARALEDRGIELSISEESFNPLEVFISGRCLARHLPVMLDLLAEMVRAPRFPDDELEKLRQLRLGELAQSQEETFVRAFDALSRLIFQPTHPHFRRGYEARRRGLETATRGDIAAVHRELFGPASLVLVMVGDFAEEEVVKTLERHFGDWQGGVAEPPAIARRNPREVTATQVREAMSDKPNLDVLLGHAGALRRRDDDFVAALLGNAVLGQSTLTSRLGTRLRDKEGLTYGVTSRFFGASLIDGPWVVNFSVGVAGLDRALGAASEEVARLVAEGPTDDELRDEASAMAGGFRVGLATPAGIGRELARLARHGLPIDELDRLPERILATTRDEVVAALRRHIAPEHLSCAIAGEFVDQPSDAS